MIVRFLLDFAVIFVGTAAFAKLGDISPSNCEPIASFIERESRDGTITRREGSIYGATHNNTKNPFHYDYKDQDGNTVFYLLYGSPQHAEDPLTAIFIRVPDSDIIYETEADRVSFGQQCLVDEHGQLGLSISFSNAKGSLSLGFTRNPKPNEKGKYILNYVSSNSWVCELR